MAIINWKSDLLLIKNRMVDKQRHQLVMGQLLHNISRNTALSPILGFKGGTCAYFFYELPRFSVDLGFDQLDTSISSADVVEQVSKVLAGLGDVKDLRVKRYTIFALLSYGEEDHNVKIEINTRDAGTNLRGFYENRQYLGIPLLVAKKNYLFSSKLVALLGRSRVAMRDVFDIHYFAKNTWPIHEAYIREKTGQSLHTYLSSCIDFIEKIPNNAVLTELGELVEEKQKSWIKTSLKKETVFFLKSYQSTLK
ncbi:MAG TPA: nucleotidyl transferase AbiEii/AbiGii toxin family protein [Candidatus Woesebacteria bacterium]|nr:nucleotidyl transferase AbiEii/AbiGii toxin family protein [Candidatus Woesebacteria bacterium]